LTTAYPPEPSERASRWDPALAALAAATLGGLSALHPHLGFVDFVFFADRAREITHGNELIDGLYPVGYPALLALGHAALGDVLAAGRVLSVLGGVIAVAAVGRMLGPAAGFWLLAQAALLQWGRTEGTDVLAAGLSLACVAMVHEKRPVAAGLLAGSVFLVRYTGLALVPLLLFTGDRRAVARALVVFVAATAPHWAVAVALGEPILPQQEHNVAIGAGGAEHVGWIGTMLRWPWSTLHGAGLAVATGLAAIGLAGALAGGWRQDRRAGLLLGFAALHVAGLGLAFANPRLVLPAALALMAGVAWLLPPRWLAGAAAVVGAYGVVTVVRPDPEAEALARIVEAAPADEPVLSTSPLFHQRKDGWIRPSVSVLELGEDLDAQVLRERALQAGYRHIVVDDGVIRRFPTLKPLRREPPPGYTLVAEADGWRLLGIDP
jgi:hypothetical protein